MNPFRKPCIPANRRNVPVIQAPQVGQQRVPASNTKSISRPIFLASTLIARLLRETPTAQQNLVIEPREVFEDSITRWDIRVSPGP